MRRNTPEAVRSKPTRVWGWILRLLIVLGVVGALPGVFARLEAERESRTVEVIVDYSSAVAVAERVGLPVRDVLVVMRGAGANAVAVPEVSIADVVQAGDAAVFRWSDLALFPVDEMPEWVNAAREASAPVAWLGLEESGAAEEPLLLVWDPAGVPAWLDAALTERMERVGVRLDAAGMQVWRIDPVDEPDGAALGDAGSVAEGADGGAADGTEGTEGSGATDGAGGTTRRLESPQQVLRLSLGFDPELLEALTALGFQIAPRPLNSPILTSGDIERRVASLQAYRPLGTVVFVGTQVAGGVAWIDAWAEALQSLDAHPAWIEFAPQAGVPALGAEVGEGVVRLHSISQAELRFLTPERATARWMRAVRERGIRALYFNLYTAFPEERGSAPAPADPEFHEEILDVGAASVDAPPDLLAFNVVYGIELVDALHAAGYTFGPARPLVVPEVPLWAVMAQFAGIAAVAVGLLRRGFRTPVGFEMGVVVLMTGGLSLFELTGAFGGVARQGAAFLAAVLFPALAVLWGVERYKRSAAVMETRGSRDERSVLWRFWARATAISLVGALFVVGLLAESRFVQGTDLFLGVKAMHVLPPLLVALGVLWGGPVRSLSSAWARLRQLLEARITVKHLIALGAVAALALVLVLRTGSYALPVAAWEQALRNALEELMQIRPRTKEFLIGHPAFILLGAVALRRRWGPGATAILAAIATVGQLSMVNTFAHAHTPLIVSLIRTVYGLLLGGAIGWIAVWVWERLVRIVIRSGPGIVK